MRLPRVITEVCKKKFLWIDRLEFSIRGHERVYR